VLAQGEVLRRLFRSLLFADLVALFLEDLVETKLSLREFLLSSAGEVIPVNVDDVDIPLACQSTLDYEFT
jgi:hypothetical protein